MRRYKNPPWTAFLWHKANAKQRRIEFLFTFEEWVSWWETNLGPDWIKLRGAKSGKYVMARNGDVGPYCSSNVSCKTHNENAIEGNHTARLKAGGSFPSAKGEAHHAAKLSNAKVRCIFLSKGSPTNLARIYGISDSSIRDIKKKRCWRHITDKL